MKERSHSVEAVLEQVAIEQFMSKLPREVHIWVQEKKPETVLQAGQLSDDYVRVRKQAGGVGARERPPTIAKKEEFRADGVLCQYCHKRGHTATECRKAKADRAFEKKGPGDAKQTSDRDRSRRCYNCQQFGHIPPTCPSKPALFSSAESEISTEVRTSNDKKVLRQGMVEGSAVDGIVLDTGCARTMVHEDLVPPEKKTGETITIRCAHGDVFDYPLAQVCVSINGAVYEVEAAVSRTLPVPVLLGRDVAQLVEILREHTPLEGEALKTVTRAQAKQQDEAETEQLRKEREAQVAPTPGDPEDEDSCSEELPGESFHQDLFKGGRERQRLTRLEKRQNRKKYQDLMPGHPLDLSGAELQKLQRADPTLAGAWEAVSEGVASGSGFYEEHGLLHRQWTPRGGHDLETVSQLVIPTPSRKAVLTLAHKIPLAGHLGWKKTAARVMQRFYWPTLFQDVKQLCKTCPESKKTAAHRKLRAPLIPLPIMEEPFRRIAMDIVGPLPRSRSGNRYILVICDYATRYPEAIPLRSIDAEHVAEELLKFFSRVGVPQEILTDQGSNFTSKLLAELYRLLKIQPIRTSPYHPQTGWWSVLTKRSRQCFEGPPQKKAKTGTDLCRTCCLPIGMSHRLPPASRRSNWFTGDKFEDPWISYRRHGKHMRSLQRA